MSTKMPRASPWIVLSASSERIGESQAVYCEPFIGGEQFALWIIAAAFIVPIPVWHGRIIATEIAMLLFALVAYRRVKGLAHLVPLLVVMVVPLLFGIRFPVRDSSKLTMLFVYVKLALFVYFIYILVERCRSRENVSWFAKQVVLPISLVLCLSALVDRYTEWPFFIEWHRFLGTDTSGAIEGITRDYGYGTAALYIIDYARGNGFAVRSADIVPWALLGLATAYWLKQSGQMRRSVFLAITLILLAAAFSMPKRSAVLTIGMAALAFVITAQTRADRRWTFILAALVIGVALAGNMAGLAYWGNRGLSNPDRAVALSRLLDLGLTAEGEEHRYIYLVEQLYQFSTDLRLLLLGSGWDFGAGVWVKPHNTYIALIVGGGLLGLIPLIIFVVGLFRRSADERTRSRPGTMGMVLLIALGVEMAINGYLFYRLEFPASTLAIWIAWSATLYRNAPLLATPGTSDS